MNAVLTTVGQGNSLEADAQARAHYSIGANISKKSRTSERLTFGSLAQLIERQLRHPEVLGSTLARVNPLTQAAEPLQLSILIDLLGLQDHSLPRNFHR